jgi:hypothetical protein
MPPRRPAGWAGSTRQAATPRRANIRTAMDLRDHPEMTEPDYPSHDARYAEKRMKVRISSRAMFRAS